MIDDMFALPRKKKASTKKTSTSRLRTKSGTLRIRKSKRVPTSTQQRYGTRRELLRSLALHELGWCTDDNLLYIKVGKAIKPVASGGSGGTDIEIKGLSDEVIVTKDSSTGKDIYTISLAGTVEDALVPAPPPAGAAGKVLTANEDGTFAWKDPVVSSVEELDL